MLEGTTTLVIPTDGQLRLNLAGFEPESVLALELFSVRTPLGGIRADRAGRAQLTISLPGNIGAGGHTLALLGFDAFGHERSLAIGVWVGNLANERRPAASLALSHHSIIVGTAQLATIEVLNTGEFGRVLSVSASSAAPWLRASVVGNPDIEAGERRSVTATGSVEFDTRGVGGVRGGGVSATECSAARRPCRYARAAAGRLGAAQWLAHAA